MRVFVASALAAGLAATATGEDIYFESGEFTGLTTEQQAPDVESLVKVNNGGSGVTMCAVPSVNASATVYYGPCLEGTDYAATGQAPPFGYIRQTMKSIFLTRETATSYLDVATEPDDEGSDGDDGDDAADTTIAPNLRSTAARLTTSNDGSLRRNRRGLGAHTTVGAVTTEADAITTNAGTVSTDDDDGSTTSTTDDDTTTSSATSSTGTVSTSDDSSGGAGDSTTSSNEEDTPSGQQLGPSECSTPEYSYAYGIREPGNASVAFTAFSISADLGGDCSSDVSGYLGTATYMVLDGEFEAEYNQFMVGTNLVEARIAETPRQFSPGTFKFSFYGGFTGDDWNNLDTRGVQNLVGRVELTQLGCDSSNNCEWELWFKTPSGYQRMGESGVITGIEAIAVSATRTDYDRTLSSEIVLDQTFRYGDIGGSSLSDTGEGSLTINAIRSGDDSIFLDFVIPFDHISGTNMYFVYDPSVTASEGASHTTTSTTSTTTTSGAGGSTTSDDDDTTVITTRGGSGDTTGGSTDTNDPATDGSTEDTTSTTDSASDSTTSTVDSGDPTTTTTTALGTSDATSTTLSTLAAALVGLTQFVLQRR